MKTMKTHPNFRYFKFIVVLAFLIPMLNGCVTRKVYEELLKSKLATDEQLRMATAERDSCNKSRITLSKEIELQNDKIKKLERDTADMGQAYRKTRKLYNDINESYEKLMNNYNRLLTNSAAESGKLSKELADKETELLALEKTLNESRRQIDVLNADLKQRESKVKELEAALAEKDKAVTDLKDKIQNALLGFKDKDLEVKIKNGKVYVSMSDKLLFKQGSYQVDKVGEEALIKIAGVLKTSDDFTALIEGHTDDVPVTKGAQAYTDNWDLSVLRSTSITRILIREGVQGRNIIAAGRSHYLPIDPALTSAARAKNRRTEIILTPRLDQLFKLLEDN